MGREYVKCKIDKSVHLPPSIPICGLGTYLFAVLASLHPESIDKIL